METVNLLEFLNSSETLRTLDYATLSNELVNFLDLMIEDEQLTSKINLGTIYLSEKNLNNYLIIDGVNRLLSLSLLLHAVCECYKKTSTKNDYAIKTIRSKYLFDKNGKTKLRLNKQNQKLYEKIINGERLSGREKESPLFILLHNFWAQIKEDNISASKIFKMLQKINVFLVEIGNVNELDLYCSINKDKKYINQIGLIDEFMTNNDLSKDWIVIKNIYRKSEKDLILFFKDFFITKFNYKKFEENRLYEMFTNYYNTMLCFISKETFIENLRQSAQTYYKILNVDFDNNNIKDAFIKLKMHNGEDTYAYILNIYQDYLDNRISEATLIDILSTINEYLKNRQKTPNNVSFNELIEYLNAFITCK